MIWLWLGQPFAMGSGSLSSFSVLAVEPQQTSEVSEKWWGAMSPSMECLLGSSQHAPAYRRHKEYSASPGFICRPGVSSCNVTYTHILHKLVELCKEFLLPASPFHASHTNPRVAVAIEQTTQRSNTGYNGLFSAWLVFLPGWLHRQRQEERAGVCLLMEMLACVVFKYRMVRATWATHKTLLSCHGSEKNQEFSIYNVFLFPAQFQPQETHLKSLKDAADSTLQFEIEFGPGILPPPPLLSCCISSIWTHFADVWIRWCTFTQN